MKIEVYGRVTQNVLVDPLDVINELINVESGDDFNFIEEKDGHYYLHTNNAYHGSFEHDEIKEIPKNMFEYIMALEVVRNYLKHNKK